MEELKQELEQIILELYLKGAIPSNIIKDIILHGVQRGPFSQDVEYLLHQKKILNDPEELNAMLKFFEKLEKKRLEWMQQPK